MKILYLAHRIPYPPNKGEKIRAWRQVEHLAARHDVWCACFADRTEELRYAGKLREVCRDAVVIPLHKPRALLKGLAGLACGSTVTENYFRSPAMRRALSTWSREIGFDVVAAFSSSMAPYALGVEARRHVLDLCDVDSAKWAEYAKRSNPILRVLYQEESKRLARRESLWVNAFDATLVITHEEAKVLSWDHPDGRLHVIGNGVELVDDMSVGTESSTPTVGFVGALDYFPNVDGLEWFAREVWPAVRRSCPQAELRMVGHSPVKRVRRLAKIAGVRVIGPVEDAAEEVRTFHVSVAPLRIARGLQNKVLEAMAAGRPVVLTSNAARGIRANHGAEYLVADDPADWARHVVRLLGNAGERTRLGEAAQRFVERHHNWKPILRRFEQVVTGIGPSRAARSLLLGEAAGSLLQADDPPRDRRPLPSPAVIE